jgi:hypothetical protein
MSSSKSAASRANGAKSNGPVTPEGKARSSRNSSSHGIFTSPVVLRNENNAEFRKLEARFLEEWAPQGPTEETLVEQMIVSRWRLSRIWQVEAAGIDLQMDEDAPEMERKYGEFDESCRTAAALKNLVDNSKFLDLMQRYDRSLSRQFDRALSRLRELQRDRAPLPEPEAEPVPAQPSTNNLQNEKEPAEFEKAKLQNEPKTFPDLTSVLPIEDARRLLHALGTYPKSTKENS